MIHICIHILPQEIDQLENLLISLKRNSLNLRKDHGILVEVCMNCNLVYWDESKIDKQFFINKLHNLELLTKSWAETIFEIDETIFGCNDLRRKIIRTTQKPYVMYLDVDNIFSDYFLSYMLDVCIPQTFRSDASYKIFVPQTTRMWDSSWDIITNIYFMNEIADHETYDNRDPYESIFLLDNDDGKYLRLVNGFKFAGWGTTIDTRLARLIDIPDSLSSYGLDDTFIMHGCQILKDKGYDVKQYVIENEIIIENNKFRFNPYKDYLSVIDKRQEFLQQAHSNFQPELQKLYDKIQKI